MTPAVRVRADTVLTRSPGSGSQFARFRLAPFAAVLSGDSFGGADLFGVDGVFGGGALVLPVASVAFARALPLARGIRDISAMRRYVVAGSFAAPVFVDSITGALIFGGSRTEAKTASDSSTGVLIWGGSAAESASFSQTRTGVLIFSGSGAESAATPVTWVRIGAFVRVS